ncbi:MAG: hypothetical protein ABI321_21185 [Polyangia bacterium]
MSRTNIANGLLTAWARTDLGDAIADLGDPTLNVAVARVLSRLVAIRDGEV